MKRRTFIVAVGSTLAWALVADAQETNQTRRVDGKRRCGRSGRKGASRRLWKGYSSWAGPTAATSRLSRAAGSASDLREYATELVALAPQVIFAGGGTSFGDCFS